MTVEIIEIKIEFPGGLTITDNANWNEETGVVHVSERLKQVVRELAVTEAPPVVTVTCHGQTVTVAPSPLGDFRLKAGQVVLQQNEGFLDQIMEVIRRPTKDQRPQFGRYAHTLSAGSTIGAFGFWHSTTDWSWQNVFSLANLCVAAMVLFYIGIISMDGE